jgi:hypothetical protein
MIELKKIINIFKNNKFETCTEIEYYNIRIIIKLAKETFLIIYKDKIEFTTYFAYSINNNNIFYLENNNEHKLIKKINYFLKIFYDIEFDLYDEYFTITEEEFLSDKEFLRNLKVLADKYNKEKNMTFSEALVELKNGKKVLRNGWNGKGMYCFLQEGYPNGIEINSNTSKVTGIPMGTIVNIRPYFMLKDAQGNLGNWQPNTMDILAEDWNIM